MFIQFIIVAAFVIGLLVFSKKYNAMARGMIGQGIAGGAGASTGSNGGAELKRLAEALGLSFEEATPHKEAKVLMNLHARMYGDYKGVPVEMKWYAHAQEENAGLTRSYSYSYVIVKTTTFAVKNAEGKSFEIVPKSETLVAKPTGVAAFDNKLMLAGDHIVPHSTLSYFAKLGWMDLMLKGQKLVFNDTFYDQFKGLSAMKMMTAVHPIYRSTAQNPTIHADSVREFFDAVVGLVQEAALV